jgi:DNA-binding transcriptional regulator YiaG
MNKGSTSDNSRDRHGMTTADWDRLSSMTDEEITAAAASDPDSQPLSDEKLNTAQPPSLARQVRNAVGLGRETFAATYGIPLVTLVAWERHDALPSEAERSYLLLIGREPEIAKRKIAS